MALRENMAYDAEQDEHSCQAGKKLRVSYVGKRKSKSGFESEVTYYECEKCEGCPEKMYQIKGQPDASSFKKGLSNKSSRLSALPVKKAFCCEWIAPSNQREPLEWSSRITVSDNFCFAAIGRFWLKFFWWRWATTSTNCTARFSKTAPGSSCLKNWRLNGKKAEYFSTLRRDFSPVSGVLSANNPHLTPFCLMTLVSCA